MWSLPDIQRLNSIAHTGRRNLLAIVERINRGAALQDEKCERRGKHRITSATPIYDIFSDDPKGLVIQCDECRDRLGTPEGFFTCEACDRLMVENYTWELYRHDDNDGTVLCLPCYAKREIANHKNWVPLTDEDIAVVTFEIVRKAKHLIAVRMPIPNGIQFFDNVEVDSSSGGELRSTMHADSTPDAGVARFREILTRAKEEGYSRAILILDGAYQFSVSIGVYVDSRKRRPTAQIGGGLRGYEAQGGR